MIDVIAMKTSAEFRIRNSGNPATPRAGRSGTYLDGRALRVGAVVGCGLFWAAVILAMAS